MRKKMYKSKKKWIIASIVGLSFLFNSQGTTAFADDRITNDKVQTTQTLTEPSGDSSNSLNQTIEGENSNVIKSVEMTSNEQDLSTIISSSPLKQSMNQDQKESLDYSNTIVTTKSISSNPVPTEDSISYSSHVSDIGWQSSVKNPEISGTTGQAKAIEAIQLNLNHFDLGHVTYAGHLSNLGWQTEVSDGSICGTTGQARPMEALYIRLSGDLEQLYDIYYRAHIADFGWLSWAKNGEKAGSEGLAKRLEAFQVQLIRKGEMITFDVSTPFLTTSKPKLSYQTNVATDGWQMMVSEGMLSGTTGQAKSIEAVNFQLSSNFLGNIEYRSHIQNIGWLPYVSSNSTSGTIGKGLQMEAIQIRLTGRLAEKYSIKYRVHVQDYGWQNWVYDNYIAGTTGLSKRIEALEAVLIEKDAAILAIVQSPIQTPYYNQRDPRWGAKQYGPYNLAASGCAPSTLAMIFSSLSGKTILPPQVADYLYRYTNEFDKYFIGTSAQGIIAATKGFGYQALNLGSLNTLIAALQGGYHVAGAVQNNKFVRNGSHEMVLRGYSNGNTYVYDPYTSEFCGWYPVINLWNERSTDKDDNKGVIAPFFRITSI
ncbi:C39 family peptidase [Streptococcus uberis]|uniref:C39 family peptidase n=1 Tax=Streptococcus uberis TaxID=1349 RepID=UPI0027DE91CB|nr:C39 family peptidase [Streptococcus uberis]MCK1237496.1 C39 family peptidase [Streptococcus uberis]